MSLFANIEHLVAASGIQAVAVDTKNQPRTFRGEESWHTILGGSIDLLGRTQESTIRLVVGDHTIVVQREGEEVVAVLLPTGHAIAKSLRRMIRRMAKKARGPVNPEPREDAKRPAEISSLGLLKQHPAAGSGFSL